MPDAIRPPSLLNDEIFYDCEGLSSIHRVRTKTDQHVPRT
jgi:hypothetical protein